VLAVPERTGGLVEAITMNGDSVSVNLTNIGITINGVPRPHPPKMLHNCEPLNSVCGSGKTTIKT